MTYATSRAVRSDPACWAAVVKRAGQIDPRAGAAIINGLVDRIDVVAPAARDFVLALAESWPNRKLREAAAALRRPPEPAPVQLGEASPVQSAAARSAAQPSLF